MGQPCPDWLTADEMSELTGVPPQLLEMGANAGLFDGMSTMVDSERRYAHDAASFVAWSDRLGDDVVAGRLGHEQARALLWRRARQVARRRLVQHPQRAK